MAGLFRFLGLLCSAHIEFICAEVRARKIDFRRESAISTAWHNDEMAKINTFGDGDSLLGRLRLWPLPSPNSLCTRYSVDFLV
jgi:hypothetical protein